MVGVGVDDSFLMVDALDEVVAVSETTDSTNTSLPTNIKQSGGNTVATNIATALSHCGASIVISSVTNAISFALGAQTDLPALRSFCIYAAVGMLFDLLFQLTVFTAALALDERRRLARRCAPWPCRVIAESRSAEIESSFESSNGAGEPVEFKQKRPLDRSQGLLCASRAAHMLTHSFVVRVLVLALYCTTAAASVYQAYQLDVGLQVQDMLADGSSVSRYFTTLDRVLPQRADRVDVIVEHYMYNTATASKEFHPASCSMPEVRLLRAALNATSFISAARLGPCTTVQHDGVFVASRIQLLAAHYGPREMLAIRSTLAYLNEIGFEKATKATPASARSIGLVLAAVLATVFSLTCRPIFAWVMGLCMSSSCVHMLGETPMRHNHIR
jgi:hypothetical protein